MFYYMCNTFPHLEEQNNSEISLGTMLYLVSQEREKATNKNRKAVPSPFSGD